MSRIDKKNVVAVVGFVLTTLVAGAAGLAWWSRHELEQDLKRDEQRVAELQSELAARAEAREAQQQSAEPTPEPTLQLLSGPAVVETLQVLQALADEAGVVLDEQKALNSADAGKQAFSINGHGQPHVVCAFLAEVERSQRLMIVETGRITLRDDQDLAFSFGVGTYYTRGAR